MTPDLSAQLTRTDDQVSLLRELDLVKNQAFSQNAMSGGADLSGLHLRPTSSPFWAQVVASGISARDLEELRQEINHFSSIRVTLAFDPDESFLQRLIGIFRQHTGQQTILLQVDVNPSIAAGIIYTIGGKITDRSLAQKIRELDLHAIIATHLPFLSQ